MCGRVLTDKYETKSAASSRSLRNCSGIFEYGTKESGLRESINYNSEIVSRRTSGKSNPFLAEKIRITD